MVAAVIAMSVLLVGCGTSTDANASSMGTLAGRVTAGPTCPVERPDHPCPPAPVIARVQAETAQGRVVASAKTNSDGHYRLGLRVGSYTLAAVTSSPLPRCATVSVTVSPNHTTIASILCDTGIR